MAIKITATFTQSKTLLSAIIMIMGKYVLFAMINNMQAFIIHVEQKQSYYLLVCS